MTTANFERLWHYTIGDRYEQIVVDGILKPADAFVSKKERTCVWFSRSNSWEETANKMIGATIGGEPVNVGLNRELTHLLGGGLVRIGIHPSEAPHDWKAYKKMSGVSSKDAKALYDSAIELGSKVSDWFVSFESIPQEKWLTVEFWSGSAWVNDPSVRPDKPDDINAVLMEAAKEGKIKILPNR